MTTNSGTNQTKTTAPQDYKPKNAEEARALEAFNRTLSRDEEVYRELADR
ncbi:hypothetical protein ACTVH1_19020 [Gluconobacter cerinus]